MGKSHGKPRSVQSERWAEAFRRAFDQISASVLDGVALIEAEPLDDERIGIVYQDRDGRTAGRVYLVRHLLEGDEHTADATMTARGFVIGDLVEPSDPGVEDDDPLLARLSSRHPGVRWTGSLPRFGV